MYLSIGALARSASFRHARHVVVGEPVRRQSGYKAVWTDVRKVFRQVVREDCSECFSGGFGTSAASLNFPVSFLDSTTVRQYHGTCIYNIYIYIYTSKNPKNTKTTKY